MRLEKSGVSPSVGRRASTIMPLHALQRHVADVLPP
jgi:hypothetical protein